MQLLQYNSTDKAIPVSYADSQSSAKEQVRAATLNSAVLYVCVYCGYTDIKLPYLPRLVPCDLPRKPEILNHEPYTWH